ncbi:YbjO family protein [Sodalis sp. dw_96]|uniref:YbjO family protein n=1 Tax=Sodalis sp. dw_96 TaxID=2719794 RepID=UPI001BD1FC89|nr:YbjO family protein [Sodalis sp. dw_96]
MSEIFRNRFTDQPRGSGHAPVAVVSAATAIIATRCVGMVMLAGNLGLEGMRSFISTSSGSWDLTLLFLAALAILSLELRCGFALLRGRSWARWCFLGCQLTSAGYLFIATWRGFYPEMFALAGDSAAEILYQLSMHKLPDVLVVGLLFVPLTSRGFFTGKR